jgi:23S rRNA (pseudouridine1915-N3)-methyltransferase
MRILILWQGKTKDPHLRALVTEFAARIAKFNDIVIEEIPEAKKPRSGPSKKLRPAESRLVEKLRDSTKVFLDPQGCQWTSEQLAAWLGEQGVRGTRAIAFVVGGPEGFSQAFREKADVLLALSRLTLTHEWSRALLLEQIYRGFTILRGFPYAR